MRTLVVGASGSTGRLLVEQLLDQGEEVKIIVRSVDSLPEPLVRHERLSIKQASLMHMTDSELMEQVEASGARIARVELVVGLDTFRPLAVDDVRQHRMHSEQFSVPEHVLAEIADARRVIAVGTTATRAIETDQK